MSLIVYQHPLSSYCHKVLIGLYENDTPFERRMVDLSSERGRAEFRAVWPAGKMPVLRDERRDVTLPETSIILEHLDRHYPGPTRLIPGDADRALQVRLWDRIFDLHIHMHMQKIVGDLIRPEGERDPHGVADAMDRMRTGYDLVERQLGSKTWITGEEFTMADCSAAPALFYAAMAVPFEDRPRLTAYHDRLLARPTYARVLEEARPFFVYYPLKERLPRRFRDS